MKAAAATRHRLGHLRDAAVERQNAADGHVAGPTRSRRGSAGLDRSNVAGERAHQARREREHHDSKSPLSRMPPSGP